MILSHRTPSSVNMSAYRPIWSNFRPNFIFWPKESEILVKNPKIFLNSKSPHLANDTSADRSRSNLAASGLKVNVNSVNLDENDYL